MNCCAVSYRDPLHTTREFNNILNGLGVKTAKLPARSPDLNSYAERFVKSVKEERIDPLKTVFR